MKSQTLPLALTIVVLIFLIAILHSVIFLLNTLPFVQTIMLTVRWYDVIIGITVYLKTSIDFALLLGKLMAAYPGWKNRVALEIGTAIGNAAGTIAIISLWVVVKHIDILLALMILTASLVLFMLARESFHPKFTFVIGKKKRSWSSLMAFSMTVPFILGLDDFAGYVPLFSVINVYGFAIGVLVAHTILNIALFISPTRTVNIVNNRFVAVAGGIAFIALGIWGLTEAATIILRII